MTTIVIRNDRPSVADDGTAIEYYPEIQSFGAMVYPHERGLFTGQTEFALRLWRVITDVYGNPPPSSRYVVEIAER